MLPGGAYSWLWPMLLLAAMSVLYGCFVLASVALTRSRSSKLRELSDTKSGSVALARLLITQASDHLLGSHLGMLLCALFAGFSVVECALLVIGPNSQQFWLEGNWFGRDWLIGAYLVSAVAIAVTAVVIISVGQAAKAVAFSAPERVLVALARGIYWNTKIFTPLITIVQWFVEPALRVFGLKIPVERDLAISPEEITQMVEISAESGEIERDEREMIEGVFSISDTLVREVMTPRNDIVSVSREASLAEVCDLFMSEGVSRLVVYGESLDEVCGVLIAKDLIPFLAASSPREFDISRVMRPPVFVPNNKKISELLHELRRKGIHFAVVVDEHGGVDGVVTIEDVLEEIVGDIYDEFDSPAEEQMVTREKNGEMLVDGSMILDDLHQLYGVDLPRGQYDTVAGFVMHQLGSIPSKGEVVKFKNYQITVEEVDQNRLTRLRILDRKRHQKKDPSKHKPESVLPAAASNNLEGGVAAGLQNGRQSVDLS